MFDFFDELDWLDIGIAGGLSEEMADEEKEIRKIEKEFDDDNSDEDDDFT